MQVDGMPSEAGYLRLTHGSANGASGSNFMISMGWAQKGHRCVFHGGS